MTTSQTVTRARKTGTTLALGALSIPKLDPVRGTFKIADLASDVTVLIPKSVDMKSSDSIRLYRGDNPFGTPREILQSELNDPNFLEFELTYAVSDFPADGTDTKIPLDYEVYDTASEDGQRSNLPVEVRFDRRKPGGDKLPPIAFSESQLNNGITVDDLVLEPGGTVMILPLNIDPYFDGEDADTVELWLGTTPTTGSYLTPTFDVTDPKAVLPVTISEQDLRSAGNPVYFGYRATDWAGNVAQNSELVPLQVYLDLPILSAPLVPENDDGVITFNDANDSPERGVGVVIPAFAAAENDNIYLMWGTETLAPYTINATEAGSDPIVTLIVPYATVAREGNGSIEVKYWIQRTGIPRLNSPATPVNVDLRTPGGPDPDPDPETPEHENIKAPEIRCGTSLVNTIQPADFGKDATATAFRVGVTPPDPIWEINDVIQLNWGGIAAPDIPEVTVTTSNTGADIQIPVPFTGVIEAVGVGNVDVFFTITRTLAAGVDVTVKSMVQIVNVVSSDALPGDGQPLAPGLFPEANASNIIPRAAGIDGTTFRLTLAGVSNIDLSKNPTISYNFVGVDSGDATTPGGAAPIEASRLKADDVAITQAMLTQGYLEVDLPYSLTYYICRNGAILDYSIANDLGRTNATQKFVRFAMNQGGGVCSVPTAN